MVFCYWWVEVVGIFIRIVVGFELLVRCMGYVFDVCGWEVCWINGCRVDCW